MRFFWLFLFSFILVAYASDEIIEYDFGTVSEHIAYKQLRFKGEIKNVVVLCDCVKVRLKYKKTPKAVMSILEVFFSPHGHQGKIEEEFILIYKDNHSQRLKLKAFVK